MSPAANNNAHTAAVNLARRWSVQNEHDLLQENVMENSMSIGGPPRTFDRDYCQELSAHMMHYSSLPAQCRIYTDIASDLKRRDSDTTHPTQFMG